MHADVLGLEAEAYQQGGYFNAGQARAHGVSRQLLDHDVANRLQPEQLSMAVTQALRRGLLTHEQLQEEATRRHKQHTIQALLTSETHR